MLSSRNSFHFAQIWITIWAYLIFSDIIIFSSGYFLRFSTIEYESHCNPKQNLRDLPVYWKYSDPEHDQSGKYCLVIHHHPFQQLASVALDVPHAGRISVWHESRQPSPDEPIFSSGQFVIVIFCISANDRAYMAKCFCGLTSRRQDRKSDPAF